MKFKLAFIVSTFVLSILGFEIKALAAESPIDLICVTEYPTTSFFVKQEGDEVNVRVLHHNGIKYAPFRGTLITPNDIPFVQKEASVIDKLGDEWNFKWKRSNCNADSPLFFQCIGGVEPFESNGVKVKPFALSVADVDTKTMWATIKQKNVTLNFYVGETKSPFYQITMNYDQGECVMSTVKKK